ncbi:MAG: dihydrofolate reductase family protein [Chloroflexi bacterium]|nr:dihydrofolate reductase family protein [Chloroflexota bacterium]MCC6891400.1 dihydrofolate reductase [Anaerolineae bacterium]
MGKVIIVLSISVDGFIAGDNVRLEEPMGEGGDMLHDWLGDTSDPRNHDVLTQGIGGLGAVITGRHNYEMSIKWWGADGPTGDARLPVFVVSHSSPKSVPESGVYTFVDGIEASLKQAQAAAGEKDVSIMGGANIAQQFINANLVDEIQLHVIPVLLGSGMRLFDHLTIERTLLEPVKVIDTRAATHLRYRLVK